ncbi:MAG: hypothetical protein ACREPN_08700 [Rudaea sp.]
MHAADTSSQFAPPPGAADAVSIGDLARDTSAYLRAWSELLASETRLARTGLFRLGFAVLVVPVLVLTICVAVDAVLAATLNRWLHDWSSSLAIVLCADAAGLFVLLLAMRRWWRNLSLPRSRDALTRLIQRMS